MVIFDLDGTLYRTHDTCLPVLIQTCDKYGLQLTKEDEQFLFCTTAKDLLNRLGTDLTEKQRDDFIYDLKWQEIEYVKKNGELFDHIYELLECLFQEGIEMAICGMGSKEYIDTVLDRCSIRKFFKYIYHRKEGITKGQALESLLKEAKLNSNECVMVGDSITDITAANQNHVPFIGVSYGYGANDLEEAIAVADDAIQLQGLIYRQLIFMRMEQEIETFNRTFVIGVNGVDTSGKTYFTKTLDTYLKSRGFQTQLIHLDDFHNERSIRMQDDTAEGYIKNAFNLQKLADLVSHIKNAPSDIEMELLDLDTDTFTKKMRYVTTEKTIIILEGVMLYRSPLDELIDYRIYLDITFDEVLNRAKIRDVPLYGEAFLERYKKKYIPAQKMYIQQYLPKDRCQLLIDNNDLMKPYILRYNN